jgi:hypothetical protein
MKDCPYSTLKQHERPYAVMLLRDQGGKTFTAIAKMYGVSVARIIQQYHGIKAQQIKLYVNHLAAVLGRERGSQIKKTVNDAKDFYQDSAYTCAYLEKEYRDILAAYRNGEPGMSERFLKELPPLRPKLSKKTIARVVEMRDTQKAPYTVIAKELRITPIKAKHIYEQFYHIQVVALIEELQKQAKTPQEKSAIFEHYFQTYKTPKTRYDALAKG